MSHVRSLAGWPADAGRWRRPRARSAPLVPAALPLARRCTPVRSRHEVAAARRLAPCHGGSRVRQARRAGAAGSVSGGRPQPPSPGVASVSLCFGPLVFAPFSGAASTPERPRELSYAPPCDPVAAAGAAAARSIAWRAALPLGPSAAAHSLHQQPHCHLTGSLGLCAFAADVFTSAPPFRWALMVAASGDTPPAGLLPLALPMAL